MCGLTAPIRQIAAFPPTLTELDLVLDHHDYLAIPAIYVLHSLTKLKITFFVTVRLDLGPTVPFDRNNIFAFSDPQLNPRLLPRTIKYLNLALGSLQTLTKDEIDALPPQLAELSAPLLNLDTALMFTARRPNCSLFFTDGISFWRDLQMAAVREKFKLLWSPQLDILQFARDVRSYYAQRRIFFDFKYSIGKMDQGRDLLFSEVSTLVCCPALNSPMLLETLFYTFPNFPFIRNAFQALQKLIMKLPTEYEMDSKDLPPNLTHLELANIRIALGTTDLPCTLRTIIVDTPPLPSGHAFAFEKFPNLTHLDAPNWYFTVAEYYKNRARWKHYSLNFLHARISGLEDVNVIDFLTKKLTPQSRRNARLWLFYHATGELFAQDDPDYINRMLLTNARLLALLKKPMPPTVIGPKANPNDCIGSIVTKLTEGF